MLTYSPSHFLSKPNATNVFKSSSLYFGGKPQLAKAEPDKSQSGKRKKYPALRWGEMNPFQKVGYGLLMILGGLSMSMMTVIMPKKELGHTLAFNRKANVQSELEKEMDYFQKGEQPPKKTKVQERSEAWDAFKRTNMSILFSYLASKNLATATVHLDPCYEKQSKPYIPSRITSEEFDRYNSEALGLFGQIGKKLMLWNFKFSEKYDLQDESDYYIPDPPPKLNFIDQFFLKHYFDTKPSWEYTEAERQKIAASYR